MELPIDILRELDTLVSKLDESDCYTDRQVAIRETARMLIYLTQDEHYGINDAFDKKYCTIAGACRAFVEA